MGMAEKTSLFTLTLTCETHVRTSVTDGDAANATHSKPDHDVDVKKACAFLSDP